MLAAVELYLYRIHFSWPVVDCIDAFTKLAVSHEQFLFVILFSLYPVLLVTYALGVIALLTASELNHNSVYLLYFLTLE